MGRRELLGGCLYSGSLAPRLCHLFPQSGQLTARCLLLRAPSAPSPLLPIALPPRPVHAGPEATPSLHPLKAGTGQSREGRGERQSEGQAREGACLARALQGTARAVNLALACQAAAPALKAQALVKVQVQVLKRSALCWRQQWNWQHVVPLPLKLPAPIS